MSTVLISNDDGIDADGIKALAEVAKRRFDQVVVVAPSQEASQIGHRVTTYEPLRYEERSPGWFAVDGTPADCTRVGLYLLKEETVDWVWSGINHGGNLGRHDYYISGTLAAAREAAFFGVKSVGVSHYMKRGLPLDWQLAGERFEKAFEQIETKTHHHGDFWAINLPHLEPEAAEPKLVICPQEPAPLDVLFAEDPAHKNQLIYQGTYHNRPRFKGSDVDICFGGDVAISKVSYV